MVTSNGVRITTKQEFKYDRDTGTMMVSYHVVGIPTEMTMNEMTRLSMRAIREADIRHGPGNLAAARRQIKSMVLNG